MLRLCSGFSLLIKITQKAQLLENRDDSASNNLASDLDPQELNSRGEVSSKRSPHRRSLLRGNLASFSELSELRHQCPEIQGNMKGCQWAKCVSQIHPHWERARECLKVPMTAQAAPSQTPGSPHLWKSKTGQRGGLHLPSYPHTVHRGNPTACPHSEGLFLLWVLQDLQAGSFLGWTEGPGLCMFTHLISFTHTSKGFSLC